MIPGPDTVIACPHCQALARCWTLASGNTFGAELWTDGKQIAPMLPERPQITQCAACQHFYWIEEAPVLGELDVFGDPDPRPPAAWYHAPHITELEVPGLRAALDAGAATTPSQEHYLRLHLWWKHNDSYRSTTPGTIGVGDDDALHEDNLTRLAHLLDPSLPYERVLLAEMARERGQFSEALHLLAGAFPPELAMMVATIRHWAGKDDRMVREITDSL